MSTLDNRGEEKGRTLGEAANRYVTFQIIMGIIGLVLFLVFMVFFFLPMWRGGPEPAPF